MINKPSITTCMKTMTGFTLIELMVTLGVLAILVAVGLPRMQGISQGNRLVTKINSLSADIAFARNESANKNAQVTVISKSGTDWSTGWDVQLNNAPNTVLRTAGGLGSSFLFTGTVNSIIFNPDGSKTTITIDTIKLCKNGDTTPHGKQVEVISTGRSRLTTGENCP